MSLVTGNPIPEHLPTVHSDEPVYDVPEHLGLIIGNCSESATWTLPNVLDMLEGASLYVANQGANPIVLTAQAGQTVAGASTLVVTAGTTTHLFTSEDGWLMEGTVNSNMAVLYDAVSAPYKVASLNRGKLYMAPLSTWNWAAIVGSGTSSSARGESVAICPNGHVMVTGVFSGTATFGSTVLTSATASDIYVLCLSPPSSELIGAGPTVEWVVQVNANSGAVTPEIDVDANGNAYISGFYRGATVTFGAFVAPASTSFNSGYVAKISADGVWQWLATAVGTSFTEITGISVGDYEIYVCFNSTSTSTMLEPGSIPISTANTNVHVNVGALDMSGTWLWGITTDTPNSGDDRAFSISSYGHQCYVTGSFNGTINFGGSTLTSVGSTDLYVASVLQGGTWGWAKSATNTGELIGNGIRSVESGIYVSGLFAGTATFGTHIIASDGANDVFVTKLDYAGLWLWASKGGGVGNDYSSSVVVDKTGAYVTGSLRNVATFGTIVYTPPSGSEIIEQVYVAKISHDGTWLWLAVSTAANGDREGTSIAVNKYSTSGAVYITGFTNASTLFGENAISATAVSLIVARVGLEGVFPVYCTDVAQGTSTPYEWAPTKLSTTQLSGTSLTVGRQYYLNTENGVVFPGGSIPSVVSAVRLGVAVTNGFLWSP